MQWPADADAAFTATEEEKNVILMFYFCYTYLKPVNFPAVGWRLLEESDLSP